MSPAVFIPLQNVIMRVVIRKRCFQKHQTKTVTWECKNGTEKKSYERLASEESRKPRSHFRYDRLFKLDHAKLPSHSRGFMMSAWNSDVNHTQSFTQRKPDFIMNYD